MAITRIVSGAQTGADRSGLDAAIYCRLPNGGWIPAGRRAEDGRIPEAYDGLMETDSGSYEVRTEANVVDSDATVVFTNGAPTGGSKLTVELARKHKKPCLHVDLDALDRKQAVRAVVEWFRGNGPQPAPPDPCVLNVAGSRESKAPSIQDVVQVRMIDVVSEVNDVTIYPQSES